MLSIDRTPERTRLLNGHDTNCRFGSSRTTSIDGSARRTYFAAVAPPQPPPITTTRRAVFGAKSPLSAGAQPAAISPSPVPDVARNSLRVNRFIAPSADCGPTARSHRAELPRLLVPGRKHSPGEGHRNHQSDRAAPAERRRQEDRRAELSEEPGLRQGEPCERCARREAGDRDPELHLPLAGAPDRADPAAAGERHPGAEREPARERAEPRGGKHPLALVLEVGVFQDGEAERGHDERQRRGARVLGVARHEGLAERAHEAEARALEDQAERGPEDEEDALRRVAGAGVEERRREDEQGEQRACPGLAARGAVRRAEVDARAALGPARPALGLPQEIAQAEERA